ncbi:nucleolin-like [Liolophura sinensis]|uniref:nucleolin-like n=1 Tax=Liolophura sinensis TaxID=3198878 RepID=UPI003158287F
MPQKSRKAMTPQPTKSKRLQNQKKTPKSVPPPKRKAFIDKDEVPSSRKAMKAKLFTKPQKAGSESDELDSDEIEEEMPVLKAGQKRKGGDGQKSLAKTPIQGKKSPGLKNITPAKSGGKKQKIEVDSDEDDDDDDDDNSDEDDMEEEDEDVEDDDSEEDDSDEDEDEDDVEKEIQTSQKIPKQKVSTEKAAPPKAKPTSTNVSKPVVLSSDLSTAQKEEDKRREIRDRKTLFVKHLPSACTVEDLEKLSSDIVEVRLNVGKKGCRGFGFLEFADEKTAEKNFKLLAKSKIHKRQLVVDFVGQKSKSGKSNQSKIQTDDLDPLKLYVTGFAKTAKVGSLEKLFPTARSIDFPTKKKTGLPCGYAFIKYDNAADAKQAHSKSKNLKLDGKSLVVLYAKIAKSKPAKKGKDEPKPKNKKVVKAVDASGDKADEDEEDSDDSEDLDYEGEDDDDEEDDTDDDDEEEDDSDDDEDEEDDSDDE